ncbi:Neural-cadherin [Penaeus vannamei]|uniref:Neural-cadherin n=1 Tax=Penaeus vannamei TaxID=6689 RepID=A0A3R7M9S4_PENVA|nr:Neural-cadherin [Penaeus vannamei]
MTIYGEVQENGPIHLEVAVVSAWDADDEAEGTNARLTYSIEKNVIDERTGQAIFMVEPDTGLVKTAICCLDRETTPEYHIQVVAVDGGGLKGSGTVVVRLADVNDNSPRLTRELWEAEVEETWGAGPPAGDTLLEVTADDRDTSNYFFYRVVEASGWGWDHFDIRTVGTYGELYAIRTLDYENPLHRRGFKFMVQVTDRGRGGWDDARHTDTAWVLIRLRDVNDNPPEFRRSSVHITVQEDTAPGTLLASMPAVDPDMEGRQRVEYRVVGGWGALSVEAGGSVRLWRALDREGEGGAEGVARVVGVDEGQPPLSSTATLSITVTDVNDCPPRLLPPTVLHVREGASAARLGVLTATDDDVWEMGHGPPFALALAASNPAHVLDLIALKFDASLDSGRGGAEVWALGPVDRERHRQLTAEVVVRDAGGLAASHPVTVVVDDVNDNPMRPAAKTVYLWKIQGGGSDASLGRVYVDDPDDWDLDDKSFAWAGSPHPLFSLNTSTGDIYASKLLREGRYELQFGVSDRVWGQEDVRANVTVGVRYLTHEALAHAVPITLTPTTPSALTMGWTPKRGGGGLGTLTQAVTKVLGEPTSTIEIVSVYGHPDTPYAPVSPAAAHPPTPPTTRLYRARMPACGWA